MSEPKGPAANLTGLAIGLGFGYLLQRGGLAASDTIKGQFEGRTSRMALAMGTAVAVGAAGIQALQAQGMPQPEVKPLKLGGVLTGATVFGTGMALAGYCPGTSVVGLGAGRRDARWAVLGMIVGAAGYVRLYPTLKPMLDAGDLGAIRLGGPATA